VQSEAQLAFENHDDPELGGPARAVSNGVPIFTGASCRLLKSHERSLKAGQSANSAPLVVEPNGSEHRLTEFFQNNSSKFKQAIQDYGMVLLRGWQIGQDVEFEKSIFSLNGITPMRAPLFVEPGRDVVPGTEHVHFTNTKLKTGGSFQFPGLYFHSENFYQDEVPGYQFFWSKKPSLLGGETAVIQMAHAFQQLGQDLRQRLAQRSVLTGFWPLSRVANAFAMKEPLLETLLRKMRIEITTVKGRKFLVLYKPCVFRNSTTNKSSLLINFSEMPEVSQVLHEMLRPLYIGPTWLLHRMAWQHPQLRRLFSLFDRSMFKISGARERKPLSSARPEPIDRPPKKLVQQKAAKLLHAGDAHTLATAMFQHCIVFGWKKDDILCLDNTQVLHCGMPGLGARELRTILANSLNIGHSFESGTIEVANNIAPTYPSIREQLLREKPKSKQRRSA
jgi:alpha-ketoglutarate-dependent taurine dioxygenase